MARQGRSESEEDCGQQKNGKKGTGQIQWKARGALGKQANLRGKRTQQRGGKGTIEELRQNKKRG